MKVSDESPRTEAGGGIVGFIFGVFLGLAVGVGSFIRTDLQPWYAAACGLVTGLFGNFCGEGFWFWFGEKPRWFS